MGQNVFGVYFESVNRFIFVWIIAKHSVGVAFQGLLVFRLF